jgi:hypothetical protein
MSPKIFAVLFAILCIPSHPCRAQTKWRTVSTLKFDWNGRPGVQAILDIPEGWTDPGDFTRVRIQVAGEKQLVLKNDEGWVKFRSDDASTSAAIRGYHNALRSDYLLAVNATSGRMILLLVGYSYASSPGSLDVVELPSSGAPRVVLHKEELGIREVTDLGGDGKAELVTYPCLSQEFGNGLLTYDPFNVYELGSVPGEPARISISLSRQYNIAHYYGWAGINCSEKLAVVLHPAGGKKPIIMKTEEAERMTEK